MRFVFSKVAPCPTLRASALFRVHLVSYPLRFASSPSLLRSVPSHQFSLPSVSPPSISLLIYSNSSTPFPSALSFLRHGLPPLNLVSTPRSTFSHVSLVSTLLCSLHSAAPLSPRPRLAESAAPCLLPFCASRPQPYSPLIAAPVANSSSTSPSASYNPPSFPLPLVPSSPYVTAYSSQSHSRTQLHLSICVHGPNLDDCVSSGTPHNFL